MGSLSCCFFFFHLYPSDFLNEFCLRRLNRSGIGENAVLHMWCIIQLEMELNVQSVGMGLSCVEEQI